MVTKLKDRRSYIKYIRKMIKEVFPAWEETESAYEELPNNRFYINFKYLNNKIIFVSERADLFLDIYDFDNLINKGDNFYDLILENIPGQDSRWRLSLCTELIDYYIEYLKVYFKNKDNDNLNK